jgi:translocation and assembly module TamB
MRRFLWLFIPSLFLLLTLGVAWHFGEKKLADFIVLRTRYAIKNSLQWDFQVENLNIQLAPPGIKVSKVILAPAHQAAWINPLKIESVVAHLDFLNLLAGQIKFSIIRITGVETHLIMNEIPESKTEIDQLPINEIFDALQFIPIKMILLEKTKISFQTNKDSAPITLETDLLLQSSPQTVHYSIKAKATLETAAQKAPRTFNLESKGALTPKTLQVNHFDLNSKSSKLGLQGEFINFAKVIRFPYFSGVSDIQFDANELIPWLSSIGINSNIEMQGQLRTKGRLSIQKWEDPSFDWDTEITNAQIQDFVLGNAKAHLKLSGNFLSTKELEFEHPSGLLFLRDFSWNLGTDAVTSTVDLKKLNLQTLFNEIHLPRIPVELLIAGNLSCRGTLVTDLALQCQGDVRGSNLEVRSHYKSPGHPIVALKEFSGAGTVTINTKEVIYQSSVLLPLSRGQSHGVINYNTGFLIDFEAEVLDFKDASPLAGLKFEGQGKLQGRTQGNSQTGTLDISLNSKDFWFEDFGLGNIESKISYQKGHLTIDAPQARLYNSMYVAQIDVNLSESRIKGLVESPDLEAQDAILALSKRVPLPFTATGKGKARAQFEGPFQLGGLTYHFDGLLEKGEIEGETFDEIRWDLMAIDGQVTIDNNTLSKGKALITVNGNADPQGILDLKVSGNNFKLENSTFLSKYVKTLGGDVNFQMTVANQILKPDILLEGKIANTTLGDSELPDSKFKFETDSIGRSVSLDIMGQQLRMDLNLPYNPTHQARLFIEVQKFDFADFLALIMGSPLRNDYHSLLSFRMDIQSKDNDIFRSTGIARVDDLYLARGDQYMRNSKPMFVYFEEGLATLKGFLISGHHAEILATGEDFGPDNLKINLGGSMDLRLLQLFTPFLEDVSGPVKGQIRVNGKIGSPEVYGNFDLNEVAVKLKGFAPVFDHINSHLEFSQKRIIIESIRGSLAGGTLVGDGVITINNMKDVRVDVKAQLRNLQMEVPEHIQSSGSADLVFSGNWFPYVLSGTYRVNQAFIDKDFSADSSDNNVRQSIYLPKSIANSGFDPVVLDLQIFLDKKVEIKNPQMSGFLTGQLQVKGPPQSPILLGSIKTLPQAQLYVHEQVFDIQSGLVKFSDPLELNPELYFTARSIVDKYEINLLMQGKSKDPQISLSSQPPLEESDIISLLALGVTTQRLDTQIQSSQQAAQTGYQLGNAIIAANPLNKEIKQSLGVDVKFSSGFDDTKNVALPRVTVSKDIIPRKLNATASSSFSENQHYDVRFQYLLNDRLSTVVTYEKSEGQEGSASGASQSDTSVFGLDLEYKVEFK